MGAFISLPLTTMMAVPLFSSYTTSLNLLFFTLNWYILLLTHPPLVVELYGILIMRLLFFLIPALIFLAFDTGIPSVAVQIKAQGKYALPTFSARRRIGKVVVVSVFNTLLGVGLLVGLEVLSTKVLRWRTLLSVSKQLPMPWKAVQSIFWGLFNRGVLQYLIHRFVLHEGRSPVAKLHKSWQHSVASPFSLVAAYDHPLPYLLHHWIPLYVPAIFFRTHLLPFMVIEAIVSMEELLTYSGYSVLPSAILVKGMARRTDLHFLTKGKGNFAAFGAVDWISGTSVGGDVVDDLKAEWDKHDMDDKVQDGADKAGSLLDSVGLNMRKSGRKLKNGTASG
ncbi:sterol desaturase family [Microthyrium microscopicum]|uniref:Sterol desaturase family n=1 Tax=Microthyrium microscopicum TaxID=703497 RepID=A0A6A6UNH3_9PEZI|nr:sterol desaturase family [Microthyrium microscopicum]